MYIHFPQKNSFCQNIIEFHLLFTFLMNHDLNRKRIIFNYVIISFKTYCVILEFYLVQVREDIYKKSILSLGNGLKWIKIN